MKYSRLFLALLVSMVVAAPLHAKDRPNIVLIMADDFGYECVGANGGESYQTPNLDRLAQGGVRFENCYMQPLCTPTRVQLMTGKYNVRNYTAFGQLHPSQKTFANDFKDAGYATCIVGKWQLGREKELPHHFGFDESYLWQHLRLPMRYANPGLEFMGKEVDFDHGEYGPDLFCQKALDFIERHKDKPFLLYYPMVLTHDPFQPTPDSPDWDPKRKNRKYSDPKHFKEMVEYTDKMIGRIVDKLDETGLREKTLLIFTGDNGTSRKITSMIGGKSFQGGKGLTTKAGMHVPLIVNRPGTIEAGLVDDGLVDSTDFLPTICQAAGIERIQDPSLDGISFYPALSEKPDSRREWIYCWYPGFRYEGQAVVFAQDRRYKLYRDARFFDLETDPLEEKPIPVDNRSELQRKASEKLQIVLRRYENLRSEWAEKYH